MVTSHTHSFLRTLFLNTLGATSSSYTGGFAEWPCVFHIFLISHRSDLHITRAKLVCGKRFFGEIPLEKVTKDFLTKVMSMCASSDARGRRSLQLLLAVSL